MERKNEMIKFRVSTQDKKTLKQLADSNNESLSSYILKKTLYEVSDASNQKSLGKELTKVVIYSDGSSKGNPGPGGYGTIVIVGEEKTEYSAGYKHTTNNRMEILGAIIGLESLKEPCDVTIYSDSQYLVNAFSKKWIDDWIKGNWKNWKGVPVKNTDLWKRMLVALKPHKVKFVWVKGHADNPYNQRCDKLAVEAALSPTMEDKEE